MKLIITGPRHCEMMAAEIERHLRTFQIEPTRKDEVITRYAGGMDQCVEDYAHHRGITLKAFPANWQHDGTQTIVIQNTRLVDYADALLLIWDGKSNECKMLLEMMQEVKKPVYIIKL